MTFEGRKGDPAPLREGGKIVSVSVKTTMESGKGVGYWVTLTNDLGQTLTPMMSYTRSNALCEATEWADFLGVEMQPFYEDGVLIEPDFVLGRFRGDDQVG
jgi:hypothetical protein